MRRRVLLPLLLLAVAIGLALQSWDAPHSPTIEGERATAEVPVDSRRERIHSTPAEKGDVEAGADDENAFEPVDPETGLCNLRVEVVDQDGRPLPDRRVAAWQQGRRASVARSDEDGTLVLRDLEARDTGLRVGPDVICDVYEGDFTWVRPPCDFVCRVVIGDEATVQGRVVTKDGDAVPGAYVGVGGMRSVFHRFVRADEDGWYELPLTPMDLGVRSGFSAWAPGYAVAHVLPSRPVEPGPPVRMDALLRPERPLDRETVEQAQEEIADLLARSDEDDGATRDRRRAFGRVVDSAGAPIAGASITTGWTTLGRSDESGHFDVEHDAYSLWFDAVGFEERQWEIGGEEAGDVVLKPRRDVRVRVVFDDDGSPVIGARVYCHYEGAITDEDGVAFVRGVDGDRLIGSVQPLTHEHPAPVYTSFEHDSRVAPLPVRVPRGGTVAGRVVDADGRPVFPLVLTIEDQPEDVWLRTDSEGRFKVVGLPTDRTVTVAVFQRERAGFEAEFEDVLPGRDVDVTWRLPATRSLSGRVRVPAGVAPGTLELVAAPIGTRPDGVGGRPREVPLEADGTFEFECVDGLSYRLSVSEHREVARTLGPENVFPAGTSGITVEARRGAVLRGRIVGEGYTSLSTRVRFGDAKGGGFTTYSTVDGRFEHTGLSHGRVYHIHVDHPITDERLTFGPFEIGTDVVINLDQAQDE